MLPPILNVGEVMLYYAKPGIGKTFLSLLLGMMAVNKGKFLKWEFVAEVKVLFIDGEMGINSLSERYKAISSELGVTMPKGNFHAVYPCKANGYVTPNISDPLAQKFYSQKIFKEGITLMIIDSYTTCTAKIDRTDDEFQQWERVKSWIIKLKNHGVTVVIVHHTNKGGLEQAGAEDRNRILDTKMFLLPSKLKPKINGTCFDVEIEKSRNFYGADTRKLHVEIEDIGGRSVIRTYDYEEQLVKAIGLEKLPVMDIAMKYGITKWEAKSYKNMSEQVDVFDDTVRPIQEKIRTANDSDFEEMF
jgi:hypothetical protein